MRSIFRVNCRGQHDVFDIGFDIGGADAESAADFPMRQRHNASSTPRLGYGTFSGNFARAAISLTSRHRHSGAAAGWDSVPLGAVGDCGAADCSSEDGGCCFAFGDARS
jgi:hypothetical protein